MPKFLVLFPNYQYFKKIGDTDDISEWISKGLSHESIISPDAPAINYIDTKSQVKFDRTCLKQGRFTFTHKKIANINITFKINLGSNIHVVDFAFGAVKLTKNDDHDKYKYSGYGIGFDARGSVSLTNGNWIGKNVIFGADTS